MRLAKDLLLAALLAAAMTAYGIAVEIPERKALLLEYEAEGAGGTDGACELREETP